MNRETDAQRLRSFGLLVGSVLAVIALWPLLLRGESLRIWPAGAGGVLLLAALTRPIALRPVYRVWMRIGEWLGWINTRIVLAIGYFLLVTPIGLMLRLAGKDPMRRTLGQPNVSYRIPRTPRPGAHMFHQY